MHRFRSLLLLVVMLVVPALGHADLRFRSTFTDYKLGYFPYQAAIADLDGDHVPDLAVATYALGVELLKGQGDGTFAEVDTLGLSSARSIAAADLDDDGDMDLVVAADVTRVYLGHGDMSSMLRWAMAARARTGSRSETSSAMPLRTSCRPTRRGC